MLPSKGNWIKNTGRILLDRRIDEYRSFLVKENKRGIQVEHFKDINAS